MWGVPQNYHFDGLKSQVEFEIQSRAGSQIVPSQSCVQEGVRRNLPTGFPLQPPYCFERSPLLVVVSLTRLQSAAS